MRRAAKLTSSATVALLALALEGCLSTAAPPRPLDHTVVVTVDDLRAFGHPIPEDAEGEMHRENWFDGSWSVEYEYESDSPDAEVFYVYSLAERSASPGESRRLYRAGRLGSWIGTTGLGELLVDEGWLPLGTESRAKLGYSDGFPFFLEFQAWEGTSVYFVTVTGLVVDEDGWKVLIRRKFETLKELPD